MRPLRPCGAGGDRSRRYMSKCIMRVETHAKRSIPQVVGCRSLSEVGTLMKSVVGHHAAQRLLAREALSGQVSHAYLITGPEQIGKTALALEFARLLQCQGRDAGSPEPCDAC